MKKAFQLALQKQTVWDFTSSQKSDHAIETGNTTIRANLLLRAAEEEERALCDDGFRIFWDIFVGGGGVKSQFLTLSEVI